MNNNNIELTPMEEDPIIDFPYISLNEGPELNRAETKDHIIDISQPDSKSEKTKIYSITNRNHTAISSFFEFMERDDSKNTLSFKKEKKAIKKLKEAYAVDLLPVQQVQTEIYKRFKDKAKDASKKACVLGLITTITGIIKSVGPSDPWDNPGFFIASSMYYIGLGVLGIEALKLTARGIYYYIERRAVESLLTLPHDAYLARRPYMPFLWDAFNELEKTGITSVSSHTDIPDLITQYYGNQYSLTLFEGLAEAQERADSRPENNKPDDGDITAEGVSSIINAYLN